MSDDVHMAKCIKCHYVFVLSNTGQRALKSDAGGSEYKKRDEIVA